MTVPTLKSSYETMSLTDSGLCGEYRTIESQRCDNNFNLLMVMIHKFLERDTTVKPDVLVKALKIAEESLLPQYTTFGEINPSEKILILVDEAHRTQSSTLGMNMFRAFPNASRIAFTGTPLITDRHKKKTHDTFGSYIDTYKLQDAVNDGATVQILYEGKTADTAINEESRSLIKI